MKTDRSASPENMSAHLSFGAYKTHGPSMADWLILDDCSLFNPTFVGFEETSYYWSAQFFSAFHWLPSVGKPRMLPVSLVLGNATESYEISLVTINRQISYNSGILRQNYGIIRDLPTKSFGKYIYKNANYRIGPIYPNEPKRA